MVGLSPSLYSVFVIQINQAGRLSGSRDHTSPGLNVVLAWRLRLVLAVALVLLLFEEWKGLNVHKVHVPEVDAAEQSTPNDVSDQGGDNTLPDVQSNADLRRTEEDSHRDKSHVGDNVIESERDETEYRPPDAHQLRGEITALQGKVATHTDEPVAADTAQEDHVELGGNLFLVGVRDDFGLVGFGRENLSIWSC